MCICVVGLHLCRFWDLWMEAVVTATIKNTAKKHILFCCFLLKTENKFSLRRLLLHACRMWRCIIYVWVYLHIIHEYYCILDRMYIRGFALYFVCHLAHTWMRMVRLFFAVVTYWNVIGNCSAEKLGYCPWRKPTGKYDIQTQKGSKECLSIMTYNCQRVVLPSCYLVPSYYWMVPSYYLVPSYYWMVPSYCLVPSYLLLDGS